jgi:hypothetical protein
MQTNRSTTRIGRSAALGVFATSVLVFLGCDNGAAKRAVTDKANAQVRRVVEELDKRTTETGVYVRVKEDDIKENDPWGTQLKVSYSQGGVAEAVTVRSAGPDKEFQTDDDVVAQGMAMNFKGVGEGIKKNAEATAANMAKGVIKGTVEGVKESIKDSLPFKRKKKNDSDTGTKDDAQRDVQAKPNKLGE